MSATSEQDQEVYPFWVKTPRGRFRHPTVQDVRAQQTYYQNFWLFCQNEGDTDGKNWVTARGCTPEEIRDMRPCPRCFHPFFVERSNGYKEE